MSRRKRRTRSSRKRSHTRRVAAHPVRRRRRRGLGAGSGIIGKAIDTGLSMAGGALYGGPISFMNLGMMGMMAYGVGGSLALTYVNPKLASGFAGGFGASLAGYFAKRFNMQAGGTLNDGNYASKDVFKALPIHDAEGHPMVIDESTGRAYCHNANGEYRELTPAEYETAKHAVAKHYGVSPAMADSYSLRDNYSLRG